jgi:hypothetical protein
VAQFDASKMEGPWRVLGGGTGAVSMCSVWIPYTVGHFNGRSKPNWCDLLVSLSTHDAVKFHMPKQGLELQYKPGTLMALCGTIFLHKVGDLGEQILLPCTLFFALRH